MVSYIMTVGLVLLLHISGGNTKINEAVETAMIGYAEKLLHGIWNSSETVPKFIPIEIKEYQTMAIELATMLITEHKASKDTSVRFVDGGAVCLLIFPCREIESAEELTMPKNHVKSDLESIKINLTKLVLNKRICGHAVTASCDEQKLKMCVVVVTANQFLFTYQKRFVSNGSEASAGYIDSKFLEDQGLVGDRMPISCEAILGTLNYSEQEQGKESFLVGIFQNTRLVRRVIFAGKVNILEEKHQILECKTTPIVVGDVGNIKLPKLICIFGESSYAAVLLDSGDLYVLGYCSRKRFQAAFGGYEGTTEKIVSNGLNVYKNPQLTAGPLAPPSDNRAIIIAAPDQEESGRQQNEIPTEPINEAAAVTNSHFEMKQHLDQKSNTEPMGDPPVEDVYASTEHSTGQSHTNPDAPNEKESVVSYPAVTIGVPKCESDATDSDENTIRDEKVNSKEFKPNDTESHEMTNDVNDANEKSKDMNVNSSVSSTDKKDVSQGGGGPSDTTGSNEMLLASQGTRNPNDVKGASGNVPETGPVEANADFDEGYKVEPNANNSPSASDIADVSLLPAEPSRNEEQRDNGGTTDNNDTDLELNSLNNNDAPVQEKIVNTINPVDADSSNDKQHNTAPPLQPKLIQCRTVDSLDRGGNPKCINHLGVYVDYKLGTTTYLDVK